MKFPRTACQWKQKANLYQLNNVGEAEWRMKSIHKQNKTKKYEAEQKLTKDNRLIAN